MVCSADLVHFAFLACLIRGFFLDKFTSSLLKVLFDDNWARMAKSAGHARKLSPVHFSRCRRTSCLVL